MDHSARSLVEWSAASRPKSGETVSGDAYLATHVGDTALIAVVDGLGHGTEAAEVANTAVAVVESHATESLSELVRWCHSALRGTRGVVMTLASIDCANGTLTWLGVGNVSAVLLRANPTHHRARDVREHLVLRGGVVGQKVPLVVPATLKVSSGDTLVIATDGIQWNAQNEALPRGNPDSMAQRLVDGSKPTDDALVVVARLCDPDDNR